MTTPTLDQALADIVTKIGALAQDHGDQAVQLAGHVLMADALGQILVGFGCAVIFAFCVAGLLLSIFGSFWNPCSDKRVGCGVAATCIGTIAFLPMMLCLASPVVWIAASDPYFAIAAKALGKL